MGRPKGVMSRQISPDSESKGTSPSPPAPTIDDPHPLVSMTLKAFRNERPGPEGIIHPASVKRLDLIASRENLNRGLFLFDSLIKALHFRKINTNIDNKYIICRTYVNIGCEEYDIRMSEKRKQVPVDLGCGLRRIFGESCDFRPSGKFVISTESHNSPLIRKSARLKTLYGQHWTDDDRERLEGKIEKIADWFIDEAQRVIAKRVAKAEREIRESEQRVIREREEMERAAIEAEARRIRAKAERKQSRLNDELTNWASANRIRDYMTAIRESSRANGNPIEPSSQVGIWLIWMEQHANDIDPIRKLIPHEEIRGEGNSPDDHGE